MVRVVVATVTTIEGFLRQLAALEDLDVLLVLRRRRGEAVDRAALALVVGIDAEAVEGALSRLGVGGLAAADAAGRWRYAGSAAVDAIVASVEELVVDDRAAVLKILSEQAVERIRRAALRHLVGRSRDGGSR
jgi:hypothetical protein